MGEVLIALLLTFFGGLVLTLVIVVVVSLILSGKRFATENYYYMGLILIFLFSLVTIFGIISVVDTNAKWKFCQEEIGYPRADVRGTNIGQSFRCCTNPRCGAEYGVDCHETCSSERYTLNFFSRLLRWG